MNVLLICWLLNWLGWKQPVVAWFACCFSCSLLLLSRYDLRKDLVSSLLSFPLCSASSSWAKLMGQLTLFFSFLLLLLDGGVNLASKETHWAPFYWTKFQKRSYFLFGNPLFLLLSSILQIFFFIALVSTDSVGSSPVIDFFLLVLDWAMGCSLIFFKTYERDFHQTELTGS